MPVGPATRRAVGTDDRDGRTDEPAVFATFIVRISQDRAGGVSGVVESVRTGERVRFTRFHEINDVIARMVERLKSG